MSFPALVVRTSVGYYSCLVHRHNPLLPRTPYYKHEPPPKKEKNQRRPFGLGTGPRPANWLCFADSAALSNHPVRTIHSPKYPIPPQFGFVSHNPSPDPLPPNPGPQLALFRRTRRPAVSGLRPANWLCSTESLPTLWVAAANAVCRWLMGRASTRLAGSEGSACCRHPLSCDRNWLCFTRRPSRRVAVPAACPAGQIGFVSQNRPSIRIPHPEGPARIGFVSHNPPPTAQPSDLHF